LLKNPNWIFVFFVAFCQNLFGYGTRPFECRTCLLRRSLTQAGGAKKSTEGNEGNEGLLLKNPNWIFVFFAAFCKNLFGYDQKRCEDASHSQLRKLSRGRTSRTRRAGSAKLIADTSSLWSNSRRVRASKCKIFQKRFDTRLRFGYKRGLAVRSLTTKPNAPAIL
jgi:hypothetical protein